MKNLPKTLHRQRAVSLFIALIALVALSIAGIALVRSVDTTNVISGNLAFRQAALHATDVGVETAYSALSSIASSSLEANYPTSCNSNGSCSYWATMQPVDTRGIPSTIQWGNISATAIDSSYSYKYVIDRLCSGTLPITDIMGSCYAAASTGAGSQKAGAPSFTSATQVYYRVTVRVDGPRNTNSIVQVLLAK